jgi:hypothetical protein
MTSSMIHSNNTICAPGECRDSWPMNTSWSVCRVAELCWHAAMLRVNSSLCGLLQGMKPGFIIMKQNPKDNPWNGDTDPLPPRKSSSWHPLPENLCWYCSGIWMDQFLNNIKRKERQPTVYGTAPCGRETEACNLHLSSWTSVQRRPPPPCQWATIHCCCISYHTVAFRMLARMKISQWRWGEGRACISGSDNKQKLFFFYQNTGACRKMWKMCKGLWLYGKITFYLDLYIHNVHLNITQFVLTYWSPLINTTEIHCWTI